MSPELKLYYDNVSISSIAMIADTNNNTIVIRLLKERKKLGLKRRGWVATYVSEEILEFLDDKELIITLVKDGMTFKDVGDKWGVDQRTVRKYLSQWGMVAGDESYKIKVSLSELYTVWADLHEDAILTINKKPMCKLVRII